MIDSNGLVVQDNGDGGDSTCRTGVCMAQAAASNDIAKANAFANAVAKIDEVQHNVYVRYAPTPAYNVPSDFSRDQASRLMIGFGLAGRLDKVRGYYKKVVMNWLRHPNGDFLGLEEISNNIRMLGSWWLYPLLLVLDLALVFDVTSGIYNQPWDYENLYMSNLWLANHKYWTPAAWLAKKLLNKTTAQQQLFGNLADPKINTCMEAYNADLWFLNNL